jgi:malonyl-CoA decarboxylase
MSVLADLLSTVFERRYRGASGPDRQDRSIETLCHDLLGSSGEVSGMVLARLILDRYAAMEDADKLGFFEFLTRDMGVDPDRVRDTLAAFESDPDRASYRAFMTAAEPPRQELARRLNQVPGATAQLVAMRADLLRLARGTPGLSVVDLDLKHLFASWFNRGFLVLRPINWTSSAIVLEKIIAYEAVHAIDSWTDLRRRLQPADRRCFGFFHPAMPDEPLIFVEVALTRGIPGAIHDVLSEDREAIAAVDADTAVFYSISNCQSGLAGISFGNSLIKQVVADLSQELPNLGTFVTLSPIPGLVDWLSQTDRPLPDADDARRQIAAYYLLDAKRADGGPHDPVARFHLGNGALIHRVHAGADMSANGQRQSGGVMVNYLYDRQQISQNHERFAATAGIAASSEVTALAAAAAKSMK